MTTPHILYHRVLILHLSSQSVDVWSAKTDQQNIKQLTIITSDDLSKLKDISPSPCINYNLNRTFTSLHVNNINKSPTCGKKFSSDCLVKTYISSCIEGEEMNWSMMQLILLINNWKKNGVPRHTWYCHYARFEKRDW